MLRIGQAGAPAPPQAPPEQTPDPQMLQQLMGGGQPPTPDVPPEALAAPMKKFDADKVPQPMAGYMGPEAGPFECQHCEFFQEPNACGIVSGDIDPAGCCNNFCPSGKPEGDTPDGTPDDGATETPDAAPDEGPETTTEGQ